MKLYAFPYGKERTMNFVAAPTLAAARKYNAEARKPERFELEAAVVELLDTDLIAGSGIIKRSAKPRDFGVGFTFKGGQT